MVTRRYRSMFNSFVADPAVPNNVDKTQKLRSQQEVRTFHFLLFVDLR